MPSGRVHVGAGAVTYGAFAAVTEAPPEALVVGIALAGIASLGPDLDRPGSALSRCLGPLSWLLSVVIFRLCGHRGLLHAPLCAVGVALVAWHWLPSDLAVAVAIGWSSHCLADACTHDGIPWIWPLRWR